MGIMNVLAELHQEPELKLNLKFEIEVLCKTLSLDLHVRFFCSYRCCSFLIRSVRYISKEFKNINLQLNTD